MKKKVIALLLAVFVLSISISPFTASASTCPPHSNYYDRVISTSGWQAGSHYVVVGYDAKTGLPVYDWCYITGVGIVYGVYCGVCNTKVGEYTDVQYYHSKKHL